jgi:hypothetical protein
VAPFAGAMAQARRITIGANPAGTDYYVIGGGIAKLFSEKLGIPAIVQPYAGSSVYLPLIQNGEITMGLSSSLDSGGAYRGEQGRQPMPKLRAVARLWPLPYAFIVRADSPIKTVADLRGKRVVTEVKANTTMGAVNRAMLSVAGIGDADVRPVSVGGLPQGVQAVVEGTADATGIAVGIPVVREAHSSVGIRYLPLAGPNVTDSFLNQQLQGLFPYTVQPAANLPEVREPVTVSGFDVFLVANADLSAADVGRMLAALHDSFEGLQQDYPTLRRGERAKLGAPSNTVPYHPAAAAFFKSNGLWAAANDARDKSLVR